ncbi:MAG: hypothetical protein ABGX22_19950 [Pirellulaceae bacterium]|nr:hypothetical protein [Planctomycetaceae bacterium]
MAKKRRIPAYVHHKASGQARVRIHNKDHYLGPYGSPESKLKYDDLISSLVIDGEPTKTTKLSTLLAAWWAECKRRYGKHGKGRYGNAVCWRPVIRLLRENHGKEPAESLGPVEETYSRRTADWAHIGQPTLRLAAYDAMAVSPLRSGSMRSDDRVHHGTKDLPRVAGATRELL